MKEKDGYRQGERDETKRKRSLCAVIIKINSCIVSLCLCVIILKINSCIVFLGLCAIILKINSCTT